MFVNGGGGGGHGGDMIARSIEDTPRTLGRRGRAECASQPVRPFVVRGNSPVTVIVGRDVLVYRNIMLTRLRVIGFKNLVDVEMHFGAFTCVAGANAVGKSNLFDAIRFLSLLADHKLDEAARSIRAEDVAQGDVRSLFTRVGDSEPGTMEFDMDIIVPKRATDELGQEGEASTTLLNYRLEIAYRAKLEDRRQLGEMELRREDLNYLKTADAAKHLKFPSRPEWQKSVIAGVRTKPLISTVTRGDETLIVLRQDGVAREGRGKKRGTGYERIARQLPRTLLSVGDADSPTVLCARSEMRRWELLQLEPSAMRGSDSLHQSPALDATGAHLAATLYNLARIPMVPGGKPNPDAVYQRVSNHLAELLGEVWQVGVDVDERRELLTLFLKDRNGVTIPARSLSDGTLSFIALVLKQMEAGGQGLLCMEEPENGIHPRRIPAILDLLQEIAVDTNLAVDEANPLRQVIINTHSPAVVQQVPEGSLIVAERVPALSQEKKLFEKLAFKVLPESWRSKVIPPPPVVTKGSLLAYLRPTPRKKVAGASERRRVVDSLYVRDLFEP